MNFYRQPIILFGIVIPLLIGLIIVGIGYKVQSSMAASFDLKMADYIAHRNSQMAAKQVEQDIVRQRPNLERWNQLLSQETARTLSVNLNEIAKGLPNDEIAQTSSNSSQTKSGLGNASTQKSSQIQLSFRGTYRTLQRAFLELETRMPQLQLEELKIDPIKTSPALINAQVTYTAWEN